MNKSVKVLLGSALVSAVSSLVSGIVLDRIFTEKTSVTAVVPYKKRR